MGMDFTPSGRPRVIEIADPTGGHYLVGVEVDPKFLEVGTAPAFGTTIDSVIDASFLDARYSGMLFVEVKPSDKGKFLLIFQKLPGTALAGKIVTGDGQLGTLTRQTVAPGTTVTPSATLVSGSVQPTGAGKSVLETVTVTDVFPETSESKSQVTKIPERFFSDPITTVSSVAAGTSAAPSVGSGGTGIIAQSKQRVTAFRVKTSTTTAPGSTETLTGAEYDSALGLSIPFTESVVDHDAHPAASDITPFSPEKSIARTITLNDAQAALTAIHLQFPTQERVQLPDKLLSAKAYFSRAMGDGQGIGYGTNWSYETSTSASVSGELSVEIEKGYSGVLPAVIHIFFLPVENATTQSITSFVGASMWPAIKEKTHSVVLTGSSLTKHWSASCSSNGGSNSDSCDAKGVVSVSHIPPTIHGNIPIEIEYVDTNLPRSGLDAVTDAWKTQMHQVATKVPAGPARDYLTATLNFMDDLSRPAGSVNPSTLEASSVTSFPEGKFILTSDVSLYKYGMVKVTAVVVDTTGYV